MLTFLTYLWIHVESWYLGQIKFSVRVKSWSFGTIRFLNLWDFQETMNPLENTDSRPCTNPSWLNSDSHGLARELVESMCEARSKGRVGNARYQVSQTTICEQKSEKYHRLLETELTNMYYMS